MVPEKKSTKSPGMGITMVVICHEGAGNPNSGPLEEQQSSPSVQPKSTGTFKYGKRETKTKTSWGLCCEPVFPVLRNSKV